MAYSTIDDPTNFFRIKLYNGNNNPQNIAWDETDSNTSTNMQPDLLWIKSRSGNTVFNHVIGNAISGGGKYLHPNTTAAETSNNNVIASFNSNGFSVGGATFVSEGSRTYVAWGWKANGSGSSNSNGNISSTVSVDQTAGCSVVSYTGTGSAATIGHGLGAVPKFILNKSKADGEHWGTYHEGLGNGKALALNLGDAAGTNSSYWNNTSPTTTVWSVGTSPLTNDNSASVAFLFAEKKGYSKFGAYSGNNNADGPFVYLGFRPTWVLIKDGGSGQHWILVDSKRDAGNDGDAQQLSSNTDDSEAEVKSNRGTLPIDLLSNGFKVVTDGSSCNGTGAFVYAAFAESPIVNSNSIPNNAR